MLNVWPDLLETSHDFTVSRSYWDQLSASLRQSQCDHSAKNHLLYKYIVFRVSVWWGWLCICMYVHTYKSLKDCPLLHYTLCLYSYFYLFPISLLCCVYHIYTFSVLLFTLERLMICIIHMLRRLCIAVDNCYAGWYMGYCLLVASSDYNWPLQPVVERIVFSYSPYCILSL